MLRLHTYFRSGAAHRVRIALNLKGLDYEPAFVHLRKGEQRNEAFLARNPQGLVPLLEDGEARIAQSLAIIEYLEDRFPGPPLLPGDPAGRARVRSLALVAACEMHPLGNLRVLQHLERELGADEETRTRWYRHWVSQGFAALEQRLATEAGTGRYCHGHTPGLADAVLVPQVTSALRFDVDLGSYPTVRHIVEACEQLEPFRKAHPAQQPDSE